MSKCYGYKICYTEKGRKREVKVYFKAYSYKQALRMKNYYLRFPIQRSREDYKHVLHKPKWYIVPITRREVVHGIWRETPF